MDKIIQARDEVRKQVIAAITEWVGDTDDHMVDIAVKGLSVRYSGGDESTDAIVQILKVNKGDLTIFVDVGGAMTIPADPEDFDVDALVAIWSAISEKKKSTPEHALWKIAGKLFGISWDDLQPAEQEIVEVLIEEGYVNRKGKKLTRTGKGQYI